MSALDDLAFEATGAGAPIVLLHPVGLDGASWRAVGDVLAAEFRVFYPDLPGHGGTPLHADLHTTADYATDVANFIARHCGGPAVVAGLSFGGMIAQELALTRPDLVDALILCGCTATATPEIRRRMRDRAALAEKEGMAAVVPSTLERWFSPDFIRAGGAEATRKRLEADDPAGWATAWRAISKHDALQRLSLLRLAVRCLAGENDAAASPDAMAVMARAIPGAELRIVAGAPHMMQIERPRDVADQIVRAMRE